MIFIDPPHDFNPKIKVAACFIEYQDQVLFLHRATHITQGNTWAIPGGKINNETPEEAVRREVLEETGFKLADPKFLQIVYIRYPDLDYEYYIFKETVSIKPPIIIDSRESQDFAWLTRKEADTLETQNKLILDEMPCIKLVYAENEFGETLCHF